MGGDGGGKKKFRKGRAVPEGVVPFSAVTQKLSVARLGKSKRNIAATAAALERGIVEHIIAKGGSAYLSHVGVELSWRSYSGAGGVGALSPFVGARPHMFTIFNIGNQVRFSTDFDATT